ncbi:MAG: bis(5'-nucleosyl)-tetraphosphatase (symmetrical) YqeK [Clostridiales bacterium]|nr:bis(5'-nucleosyl)-tetraphosphatase (symmetrical) YqeK [Clostridiales bacterium]
MIRTVIFGGSFDPVHRGHEAIINLLADRFDKVLVVPTYVSPFKKDSKVAPARLRLEMLRSCAFKNNVIISDYEITKPECSYSIETVRHFYADDQQLYFAIGSEGARSVDKWRQADELKKLCKFYVIKRPGYDERHINSDFIYADFSGEDVSSSEVKVAVALGKADELVNSNVAKIIKSNNLYDDYVQYVEAFKTFGLKPERVEHTYRATIEGIKLAKRYDVNVKDATIALLMHDIGKYMTPESLTQMGIPVPDCEHLPEVCRHAEYGASICEHYFKLPPNIVEAVRTHTTCAPNMDSLGEIVALADYIEPNRKFAGINALRRAATISLPLAMEMMLKNTIDFLTSRDKYIAPVTFDAYHQYTKINKGNNFYGTN